MTYPNGRILGYSYGAAGGLDDAIGRVRAIAEGVGGATIESYAYLGAGTVVERAQPGARTKLTYVRQPGDVAAGSDAGDGYSGLDRFGRVVDQNWVRTAASAAGAAAGSSTVRLRYGYDRDGDALFRRDLVFQALSELYRYDQLDRLTSFKRGVLSAANDAIAAPLGEQSWTLDARGNQTVATTGGVAVSKTFDEANRTTSVSGGSAPVYDDAGNTVQKDGRNYVYDAWGRLKRVMQGAATVASYAYDALRRRIVETSGGATADVYFDGGTAVEERVGGAAAVQYVYGATGALVLRDSLASGSIVAAARLYAQQDAVGNVVALIGGGPATAGDARERYTYLPYGGHVVMAGNGVALPGSAFAWRQRFQGGRYDEATGLYQFGFRDLDPASGVWMERDPIGLYGGDPNLYRFVAGNPVNFVDPSGLADWIHFDWGAFGGYYYDMGAAIASGEAGEAWGERMVRIVRNNTGREFAGTAGDWLRFGQVLGGEMSGGNAFVEGVSGYDAVTLGGIGGVDRWARGLGGGGGLVLSGAAAFSGIAGLMPRSVRCPSVGVGVRESGAGRHITNGPEGAMFDSARALTSRQRSLLGQLGAPGAEVTVGKGAVSMNDLRNLMLHTGDEFAMLTRRGERLVIRGEGGAIPTLDVDRAGQMASQGWRFSGHTHTPGYQPVGSVGDKNVLRAFRQRRSAVWGSEWGSRPGIFYGNLADELNARLIRP